MNILPGTFYANSPAQSIIYYPSYLFSRLGLLGPHHQLWEQARTNIDTTVRFAIVYHIETSSVCVHASLL